MQDKEILQQIRIASKEQLEHAALCCGMLPFFSNNIIGFSIQEMAAPGMLFGGNEDYGCWEWKGPVIREQTTAYGKFFNRKAGFVALELLPDFLNYRRHAYPVKQDSVEQTILDIIRQYEGITSTELKKIIFGSRRKREAGDIVGTDDYVRPKRHSLEGSLQRLQMGGWLLIADFEYRYTRTGNRYGWGVALYSTPEIWFERSFGNCGRTPAESLDYLVERLSNNLRIADPSLIRKLIK